MNKNLKRTIKESDIQKAILDYLKWKGIFCWRNNTVGTYDQKTQGYRPSGAVGVSDILGVLPSGKFLAIEVKKPGGHVTESQQLFLDGVVKNGGLGFVAHNLDEVIVQLEQNQPLPGIS